jgi:uncharacterized protein YoxC
MLAFAQAATADAGSWVGPIVAISLLLIALVYLLIGIVVAIAARATSKRVAAMQETLADLRRDLDPALKSVQRVAEDGGAMAQRLRSETDELVDVSRQLRKRLVTGADRIQERLEDMDALYEVVYDEVEESALSLAAGLRTARHGKALLAPVSRLFRRRRRRRRR